MNIFQDVLKLIENEEKQKALPLLATAINNVAATPTAVNVTAQGGLLLASLITAEVGIGQDALKEIASDITATAAASTTSTTTTASAASAPTAAASAAAK